MDALYRARDWFASLPSILVVVAILMLSAQTVLPPKKEVVLPPMEISLTTPPEPEPPKPVPPEPQPTPVKPAEPRPQPVAKPVVAPQQPAPPVAATPSASEPATVPATPSTPAPARPVEAAPEAPPAPPPPPRNTQSTENAYIGKVRVYLDSTKRYPTGREASSLRPRGVTKVWFVLTRGGEATDAGIEDSSGSILLDNAALASVRRGRFAPFPDDAWPGQPTHRFTAELNFTPPE